jgi:hypothetical protein
MSTKTDDDKTMIQVTIGTRKRLIAVGGKNQSYDDVINDLLDREVDKK